MLFSRFCFFFLRLMSWLNMIIITRENFEFLLINMFHSKEEWTKAQCHHIHQPDTANTLDVVARRYLRTCCVVSLKVLNITESTITDNGLLHMTALNSLEHLDVSRCFKMTALGVV
ncbi:Hypothetical protein, putative, partial [Bodo saltans]